MRDILFKGKRIDNGEWVEGYYVKHGSRHWIYTGEIKYMYYPVLADLPTKYEVDPETVCQYTGLTDKNNLRIFEGDIAKQFSDCSELGESLYFFYKIRWNKEYCAFEGVEIYSKETFLFPDLENIEVIGNIFDNPEFLKGDETE